MSNETPKVSAFRQKVIEMTSSKSYKLVLSIFLGIICVSFTFSLFSTTMRFISLLFAITYNTLHVVVHVTLSGDVTFEDLINEIHVRYIFVLASFITYNVKCYTLAMSLIFVYSRELNNFINAYNVELNSRLNVFVNFLNELTMKIGDIFELLPMVELFFAKEIFRSSAKYALLFYEYIIIIVSFQYAVNENHKHIWSMIYNEISSILKGGLKEWFIEIANFFSRVSFIIVNRDVEKRE